MYTSQVLLVPSIAWDLRHLLHKWVKLEGSLPNAPRAVASRVFLTNVARICQQFMYSVPSSKV